MNSLVVEVKEVKVDPQLTQGVGFNGQKLSLNFQNIEVRALLQVIADFTNFNVVTSGFRKRIGNTAPAGCAVGPSPDIILQAKSWGTARAATYCGSLRKTRSQPRKNWIWESAATNQSLEPLKTQFFKSTTLQPRIWRRS